MAWVAVDKDGSEWVHRCLPVRCEDDVWIKTYWEEHIELPKGSIKKLIGRELTWSDEPVELE
jgi:hypothetical protein